jgi:RNA polymerase sigma-70 factor (ECF subfamily)
MESSELYAELEALHPQSYGWALVCCAREAECAQNALQAVYLKILNGKAVFEGKSSFKTWLFAVIRRTSAEQRRRRVIRRLRFVAFDELNEHRGSGKTSAQSTDSTASGAAPDVRMYKTEIQRMFGGELAALPKRQREVLHLVFYQDLTLAEAAQVMGVSVGSARTHYERGKKRLRTRLIERGVTSNAGLER